MTPVKDPFVNEATPSVITPDASDSALVRDPPERVATPSVTSVDDEDAIGESVTNANTPLNAFPLAALLGLQAP